MSLGNRIRRIFTPAADDSLVEPVRTQVVPTSVPQEEPLIEGITLVGGVNVGDSGVLENIKHSIRLGHQQVRPAQISQDRVLLVGGGPSLNDPAVQDQLVREYFEGAKVVALNNSMEWLLDRNIRPSAQIVVDARPGNARFIDYDVPNCQLLLASQCHPDTWAAASTRENVWIWHAADGTDAQKQVLDDYYQGRWVPIGGGTTVAMRGLSLMRSLGFVRFSLFGIDSCWLDDAHHAYTQPENDQDGRTPFWFHAAGRPEARRRFVVSSWHIKQLEDFIQLIRMSGDQFQLTIHGDGLLAYALQEAADIHWAPNDKE